MNSQPAISLLSAIDRQGWRSAAVMLGLMLAAGLTEGLGLVLLVPMLEALGAAGQDSLPGWLAALLPSRLGPLLAMFVVLVVLRAIVAGARNLAQLRFEAQLVDGLRNRSWSALMQCDWRVLAPMSRSNSTALLVGEIDRIGVGVNQLLGALTQAATLGAIGLAALAISPVSVAIAAIAGMVALVLQKRLRRRAGQLGEGLSQSYSAVFRQIAEGLASLRLIKSLGREAEMVQETAEALSDMRQAQYSFTRDVAVGRALLHGGAALLLAVLTWVGVTRWQAGPATILPLVALFGRALPLVGAMQEAWLGWAHARAPIAATLRLIEKSEAAREPDSEGLIPPRLTMQIRLDKVSVQFEGEAAPALNTVTATIPARGIVAITGPSGAGKSTLADLIGGLVSPDSGQVLIDGIPLEGSARRAWRQRVAYVQQDPVLLSASLADNLRWAAPDADEARMVAALRDASAEFALSLPQGLHTRLGDGGRQLSGGERQRLMLARALLRDPALLILDEATSALDAENEAQIASALRKLKTTMVIVIIGHRGALATLADGEIRLENGSLAPEN
jgi:ATP-binding cassette, subfamily C, bacterial